ncbi:MAG: hypothetical protein V4590_03705 [Bacteroidota bacterium]
MKQAYSVAHISHGVSVTGGYLHEQFVFNSVCNSLEEQGCRVSKYHFRTNRFFKGLSQLKMVWQGMVHAQSNLNLVSNWMALYAIWRNVFAKRKIVITWHHHDEADVKTTMTRLYMKWLFNILANTRSTHIAIMVVSDYWATYFKSKVSPSVEIVHFPNLFDTTYYQSFKQTKIPKQIYLGQYAFKTDDGIFELAHQLTKQGYSCFFTTLIQSQVGKFDNYEINRFDNHSDYLNKLAQSAYSIAYIKLNEGWNRVAHESILVGTQVIGNNKGGLSDLLKESNSLVAHTVEEFSTIILQNQTASVNPDFIRKYDASNRSIYSKGIIDFIEK